MSILSRLCSSAIQRLSSNKAGSSTVIFSLAGAVIIGCGGMAIDYAYSRMQLTAVQANLDAAVLAGVSATLIPDKQLDIAKAYFKRFSDTQEQKFEPVFTLKNGVLKGTIEANVPTTLLRVLNVNYVTLKASSSGVSNAYLEPLCFMAMHPTRKHTLELKGSVSVIAPDCNIYGNSNHEFDVIDPHTPENFVKAKWIATIGGGHHFLENVSPPPEFGTTVIEDPLKSLGIPAAGACTQTKYSISGKSMTLPAGHYCKGLTIKSGSNVALEDGGTYYVSGGAFEIEESTLTGKDVTIFLTDADANIEWSKAVVRISAKRSDTYAGIAVMGVREETDNTFEASTIDIHGVFYMPMGAFEWDNEGTPKITAKWSAFVIDGVSWVGNGVITINFDRESSDVPYPKDLIVMPRPGSARLIN